MAIPHYLIEQIKVGQVVLFLGSGASKGASHPEGKSPPVGDQLANLLSDKFLGIPIAKYPLARVAELSVSESDLFTVQNYIHSIFINFSPADFHKLIPSLITLKKVILRSLDFDPWGPKKMYQKSLLRIDLN